MPDASTEAPPAAASRTHNAVHGNPDRVGEELADDARIWRIYDRVAKGDDDRRIANWNRGLDNLALFAGLFSAVTTAFIIEAQKEMKPDFSQLTFLVLNATASGNSFLAPEFVVPSAARTINCLWIASLLLSLSAALIAIMGKDWIGMYASRPACNLRQWAEMRSYRLRCVDRWCMSGVIAAAPVLLHIALLLFGAGLVLFMPPDPVSHHITLGLALGAGVLYAVTVLSATIFPTSPFKSPATQMLRVSLAAVVSYGRGIFSHRPRRAPVITLVGVVGVILNAISGPTVSVLPSDVPRSVPGLILRSARRQHGLVLPAAILPAVVRASRTVVRWLRNAVGAAWDRLHFLINSALAVARSLQVSEWTASTSWTECPNRSPELIAESLSWLSAATQAPDDLRALIFALGDLELGKEVGHLISWELRTRVTEEVRRKWEKVDFLTLSRYVLAERNMPQDPVLNYQQFLSAFDVANNRSLCSEDGLAAVIKIRPEFLWPRDILRYCPDRIAQPRMMEFLLPYVVRSVYPPAVDSLITLANQCWTHTARDSSIYLENELYQCLRPQERDRYRRMVTSEYGGISGRVELLAFFSCSDAIMEPYITKRAAVQLIMKILQEERLGPRARHARDHPCLAYVFGSSELSYAAWTSNDWSRMQLDLLVQSLKPSLRCAGDRFTAARQTSMSQGFERALAYAVTMLLSPLRVEFYTMHVCIEFLSVQLDRPPSRLDDEEKLYITRLILKVSALATITCSGDPLFSSTEVTIADGISVLAGIAERISLRLLNTETFRDGEHLFCQLVCTEAGRKHGQAVGWDLGHWLVNRAPTLLVRYPSVAPALQRFHNAMTAVYPHCALSNKLRSYWDHAAYPGRPDDIFSDPFLSIGVFFANAETPLHADQSGGSH